jgi:hypothetical protein
MAELSVEGMSQGRGDAGAIVPDGTSFADRRGRSPVRSRPDRAAGRGSLMSTQARNIAP